MISSSAGWQARTLRFDDRIDEFSRVTGQVGGGQIDSLDARVLVADTTMAMVDFDKLEEVVFKNEKIGLAMKAFRAVRISPEDADRAQELRDWGDFVHIRHIAETAVPGFGMITPYRNPGVGPAFLHFYELHGDDPEAAFQAMTPLVAERLGGVDTAAYRAWAWHPQLRIDYVNTFAVV